MLHCHAAVRAPNPTNPPLSCCCGEYVGERWASSSGLLSLEGSSQHLPPKTNHSGHLVCLWCFHCLFFFFF